MALHRHDQKDKRRNGIKTSDGHKKQPNISINIVPLWEMGENAISCLMETAVETFSLFLSFNVKK